MSRVAFPILAKQPEQGACLVFSWYSHHVFTGKLVGKFAAWQLRRTITHSNFFLLDGAFQLIVRPHQYGGQHRRCRSPWKSTIANLADLAVVTRFRHCNYRDAWRYLLLGAAGILTAWTWIDPTWFVAAWVGLLVLVSVIHGAPAKLAFRYAFCFGLAGFLVAFQWCPAVIADNLGLTHVTAWMLFLVLAGWNALQFGVFGYLAANVRRRVLRLALTYAVVWVAVELVWPHLFPWRLGHSQIAWTPLIQITEFTGAYGISFVLVWGAAAGAILLNRMAFRRSPTVFRFRSVVMEAVACGVVLLFLIGYGHWRIDQIERSLSSQPSLRVAIIQPAVSSENQMAACRALSRRLPAPVDLICWPESSVGTYSLKLGAFDSSDNLRKLSRFTCDMPRPLPRPHAYLLCAGRSYADDAPPQGPYYVTAFLVDRQERIIGRYHKRSLMPFGEYVPGQEWIPRMGSLIDVVLRFRSGRQASSLRLSSDFRLGVLICYEDLNERYARDSVRAGAGILCSLNNTSLFGRAAAVPQHQQLGLLRAVENRRYLMRCGTNGISSVVAPTGRVVAEAEPHREATIIATVHASDTRSFYTHRGNVFAYVCLVATAVLAAIAARDRKQPGLTPGQRGETSAPTTIG